jgi:hypothetical protein
MQQQEQDRTGQTDLVDMRNSCLLVHRVLGDVLLINPQTRQQGSGTRIDLLGTITDNANHNLPPRPLSPITPLAVILHVIHILKHAHQRAGQQVIPLIVHGDDHKQLRLPRHRIQPLPEREPLGQKLLGITRGRRVPHVRKLPRRPRRHLLNLLGQLVVQPLRHGAVQHQVAQKPGHLLQLAPCRRRRRRPCCYRGGAGAAARNQHRSRVRLVVVAGVSAGGGGGLVWLVLVGVVVGVVGFEGFAVAVGVGEVLDGKLGSVSLDVLYQAGWWLVGSCVFRVGRRQTHGWLGGQSISGVDVG